MSDLPSDPDIPAVDPADAAVANQATEDDGPDGLLDRLRHTGVGVEDPNIVGDAGPTDVAPGRDPEGDGLLVVEDEGELLGEGEPTGAGEPVADSELPTGGSDLPGTAG